MRVLLLAPEPFYQERGTPIAVSLILRALSARGDQVDALVYHEGAEVSYPGVTIHRLPRIPFVRGVRPGFSLKKLVCDAVFWVAAVRLALRRPRHDVIHAVEESVFIARFIRALTGTPYLYDMDSFMSDQMTDRYPALRLLRGGMRWIEGRAIGQAEVVVPVCDALADVATRYRARAITVLRDISLLSEGQAAPAGQPTVRETLGVEGPLVMYVGNLERYQGIDLLLESFAIAHRRVPQARLVVIGGPPAAIESYTQQARQMGLDGMVRFVGPRPVAALRRYLEAADVLVSPRLAGGNTPMKIYSYLDAGRAVLATKLPTHTQVLTDEVALLADPTPPAMADGLVRLLKEPELRRRLGRAGQALVAQRHTYSVFQRTLQDLYQRLEQRRNARA